MRGLPVILTLVLSASCTPLALQERAGNKVETGLEVRAGNKIETGLEAREGNKDETLTLGVTGFMIQGFFSALTNTQVYCYPYRDTYNPGACGVSIAGTVIMGALTVWGSYKIVKAWKMPVPALPPPPRAELPGRAAEIACQGDVTLEFQSFVEELREVDNPNTRLAAEAIAKPIMDLILTKNYVRGCVMIQGEPTGHYSLIGFTVSCDNKINEMLACPGMALERIDVIPLGP